MKIGIITMHRVLNYGSALQAYALQRTLDNMGYDNEIIDYEFPRKGDIPLFVRLNLYLRELFYRIRTHSPLIKTKRLKFKQFYKNHYKLSAYRCDRLNVNEVPIDYDILLTGSDQVWNPNFIKNDQSFFWDFAPLSIPRISYASSFAVDEIPENLKDSYKEGLSKYSYISVRENSGIKIVKELTGKVALTTCDPTLLLKADDYNELAMVSKIKIPKHYILVYLLTYMYDPYPEVNDIIRHIHDQLQLPVIYLDGSKYCVYERNAKVISDLSPSEFTDIFRKATFVVTSSFHGTAFSLIFQRAFISIVKRGEKDSRILSLLNDMNSKINIVYHDEEFVLDKDISKYVCNEISINQYRERSINILKNMIISVQ